MPSSQPPLRAGGLKRPKTAWRKRLFVLRRDFGWHIVGGLWLGTLVLGYVGFACYHASQGEARTPLDLLYRSLQLFTLESGSVNEPVPWTLEVARFLAPAIAGYTVLAALAAIFTQETQMLLLRFRHGHVVVCGLGRKGTHVARAFHKRGYRVVAIEKDPAAGSLQACRELGIVTLVGDAHDPFFLRRARVQRASYVCALTGDDGTNADIATHVRALAAESHKKGRDYKGLTCVVHVFDQRVWQLLRHRTFQSRDVPGFKLDLFNIFDAGARALLRDHPYTANTSGEVASSGAPAERPHLLVVGAGRMAEAVIVQAALHWRHGYQRKQIDRRLKITVVDLAATEKVAALSQLYPRMDVACELVACAMDVQSPEFELGKFLLRTGNAGETDSGPGINIAYVCLDDDSQGLAAALTLRHHLPGRRVVFVVQAGQGGGLAGLLSSRRRNDMGLSAEPDGDDAGSEEVAKNLHAFPLYNEAFSVEELLESMNERLARAVHEEFKRQLAANGHTRETHPAMVHWDDLHDDLKESNRDQAAHIGEQLRAMGYGLKHLSDWDAELVVIGPDEVEQSAQMEHKRFVEERKRAGWTYGPVRDDKRKTHPTLVPWDELSEEEKEKDRNAVRNWPRLLREAGIQVYRL